MRASPPATFTPGKVRPRQNLTIVKNTEKSDLHCFSFVLSEDYEPKALALTAAHANPDSLQQAANKARFDAVARLKSAGERVCWIVDANTKNVRAACMLKQSGTVVFYDEEREEFVNRAEGSTPQEIASAYKPEYRPLDDFEVNLPRQESEWPGYCEGLHEVPCYGYSDEWQEHVKEAAAGKYQLKPLELLMPSFADVPPADPSASAAAPAKVAAPDSRHGSTTSESSSQAALHKQELLLEPDAVHTAPEDEGEKAADTSGASSTSALLAFPTTSTAPSAVTLLESVVASVAPALPSPLELKTTAAVSSTTSLTTAPSTPAVPLIPVIPSAVDLSSTGMAPSSTLLTVNASSSSVSTSVLATAPGSPVATPVVLSSSTPLSVTSKITTV